MQELIHNEVVGSYIAGAFAVDGGKRETLVSPVTQAPYHEIVYGGREEAEAAIAVAQEAFFVWKATSAPQRARCLREVAQIIHSREGELAELITMEMGKPICESRKEVNYAAGFFDWFAGEAERIYGMTIPSQFTNKELSIRYQPVGVCGVITPWNFPLAMPARKIAAALAAGCSVVMKPSPETPVCGLVIGEICRLAGIPNGVMNIVVGDEQAIGSALLDSNIVRKISFTGSCEVGKYLYEKSAKTMKKITMELGGNAPVLVFDDVPLEQAVEGSIATKFRNTGQTCICANRIFVQSTIYEEFVEQFTEKAKELIVGDPRHEQTQLSSVLHPVSAEKVTGCVADALDLGATGNLLSDKPNEAQVLSGVTPVMRIFTEEVFGPVAALIPFTAVDEGISMANAGDYGLASYLFTRNMAIAHRAIEELQYGMVGLNDPFLSTAQASFGGIRHSGIGREGGPTGIREYLVEKYVSAQISMLM
ncbi:MAG: NAD-dependent succinate-semialdehyde dehydrogenase [Chlamydiales bacterium]|nr:NAD-dependent succinate-semialdehyde dehydrogenase [Chlamydiia bacterium]MCP5507523.1 NAD-dependent succinate-semialdehyde dehydrogenase [Chlamydiales bacterium]